MPKLKFPRLPIPRLPKLRYLLFGLVCYLAFLIATLPADMAYGYWKKTLGKRSPVTMTALSGSVWSGQAGASRFGTLSFDSLKWNIHFTSLLLGKLQADWEFSVPDGYGKGVAGVTLLGNIYLNQVDGLLPMMQLARLVNMSALKPDGSLGVNVDRVRLKGKTPTLLVGNLVWHDAQVTLLKPMSLGTLQAKFDPADDGIKGVLSDQGGPLQMHGLVTLSSTGNYDLNLALSARDSKQVDLVNALRGLGRPDNAGKYHIKRSGKLSNLRF